MDIEKIGDETVVNRFRLSAEPGYSEFWRRNKSPIAAYEMARLLSGMRKVASYVGRNSGTIIWSGMDASGAIAIDPAPVMGQYPVPAIKTDRILGLTIRKAYRKTEWSGRFYEMAQAQAKLPTRFAYKFQLFFNMCENVYLDCLSNRTVLGVYTEAHRAHAINTAFDGASHPPTISELLHIWWGIAADRSGTQYKQPYTDTSSRAISKQTSLEKFYKKPIELLNTLVEPLVDTCPRIQGVTERGNFRVNLYQLLWPTLFEMIKYWATDSKDPFLLLRKVGKNVLEPDGHEDAPPPPVYFSKEIQKILPKRTIDFTDRVKEIVFDDKADVVRVEINDIVMPAQVRINKKLLHHLKLVIKTTAQKITLFNRGLRTGKIDRRRLYRAPTTGTIFQTGKDDFELVNDIILLIDATGSMASQHKWEFAEEIYQTLFTALKSYNKNARLFAYNEFKDVCRLTELYQRDKFYSIFPHGKTASGEAIIASILRFKSSHKKPFIIHLTDGASNWGCGVENAIRTCQRKRVNLLTLGMWCGKKSKEQLIAEYGNLVQFVDSVDSLPLLFRTLLNKSKWS
ncbi:vWA domain-containing protein [Desulfosarcina ovata]|uniref:VWFA domain-containing protein n=2 Tax=Desulfosarcina ovata TaxID=83564 RepID=A0A5K8ALN1_9BACT|nr:vWA domain-containing protein [Desulfosarcina ovata]BBO86570.1 hypothetical protein DSCO28_71360 [Desulfosarcina ovata subsp. sediminis]BBO93426.1 hypothetical protein DSCOOX_66060 [Desulfosarcina ovata subsp. ovata]